MMTTELVTDPVIKQYLQEKVAGHMGSDSDAFKDCPVVGDGEGRHMLWSERPIRFSRHRRAWSQHPATATKPQVRGQIPSGGGRESNPPGRD